MGGTSGQYHTLQVYLGDYNQSRVRRATVGHGFRLENKLELDQIKSHRE